MTSPEAVEHLVIVTSSPLSVTVKAGTTFPNLESPSRLVHPSMVISPYFLGRPRARIFLLIQSDLQSERRAEDKELSRTTFSGL